ncbi:MAG: MMPL family transporter [Candidatus Nanopelagicales bacterium]
MRRLSGWAVRRPVVALISWFVAVAAIAVVGLTLGGKFNDSFELPDTESTTAQSLLQTLPRSGATAATATIVWSPEDQAVTVTDPSVVGQITPLLETVAANPSVSCVITPYGAPLGADCPQQEGGQGDTQMPPEIAAEIAAAQEAAAQASSPISADGRVALATVIFPGDGTDVSTQDAKAIIDAVKQANGDGLSVGANGSVLEFAGVEPPSSEAIGLLAAIVILLIAFGSLVAAGLPIVVALVGLTAGQMLVLVVANFLDVATFAPTLAAMIGLGVGIDYALFVLNRYRQAIQAGHEPKKAAQEAVDTAGRAVLFAGTTVIIALLGLFVLRINFFNGLAVAAAVTVLMVMLSALWMLPALLSLLGTKALSLRLPWARRHKEWHPEGGRWAHYGRLLQRQPWIPALLALGAVVLLALPTLSLRLGFTDDSGKAEGSIARTAYDLQAEGFGAGVNGPFYAAITLPEPRDYEAYSAAVQDIVATPGVARTLPTVDMLPLYKYDPSMFSDNGIVGSVLIIPDSAPQDEATTELLDRLRTQTAPQIQSDTGATMYIGGFQAVTQDFTDVLTRILPVFLSVVVGLGFLALVLLFRSIVVPLTAAITSLLSFGAALGITVAVFQWGWFADLLGVASTGPIFPFLPVMVFAILFGLSMDYQVFLVSRMQEEWSRGVDNRTAVRRGLAGSGRVVVIAALIMSSVFLAFVPSTESTIKLFGVALASAVLIDAFIVRLVLVPSVMSILGRVNWWLPGWLDRILPTVQIEGGSDEIADDEEPDATERDREPVGV